MKKNTRDQIKIHLSNFVSVLAALSHPVLQIQDDGIQLQRIEKK